MRVVVTQSRRFNALKMFSDICACLLQTPDDPMHQVNLGLWVNLLNDVFYDLKMFLEAPKRPTGTSYFGKAAQDKVWDRQSVLLCFCVVYNCQL